MFSTTTVTVAWSQFAGVAPTSQISYTTVYVPDGVFAFTVIVPSAFNVNPAGTVTPVKVTSPGLVPITTGLPSNVSFNTTLGVESPTLTVAGVSFTASITFNTVTVAVAWSQFAGVAPTSQIWYTTV